MRHRRSGERPSDGPVAGAGARPGVVLRRRADYRRCHRRGSPVRSTGSWPARRTRSSARSRRTSPTRSRPPRVADLIAVGEALAAALSDAGEPALLTAVAEDYRAAFDRLALAIELQWESTTSRPGVTTIQGFTSWPRSPVRSPPASSSCATAAQAAPASRSRRTPPSPPRAGGSSLATSVGEMVASGTLASHARLSQVRYFGPTRSAPGRRPVPAPTTGRPSGSSSALRRHAKRWGSPRPWRSGSRRQSKTGAAKSAVDGRPPRPCRRCSDPGGPASRPLASPRRNPAESRGSGATTATRLRGTTSWATAVVGNASAAPAPTPGTGPSTTPRGEVWTHCKGGTRLRTTTLASTAAGGAAAALASGSATRKPGADGRPATHGLFGELTPVREDDDE